MAIDHHYLAAKSIAVLETAIHSVSEGLRESRRGCPSPVGSLQLYNAVATALDQQSLLPPGTRMATLLSYLPEISPEGLEGITSVLRTEVERILCKQVLSSITDILLAVENDLKAEGLSWDDLTTQGQVENARGVVPSDRPIPSDQKWSRGETVGDKFIFNDWRYRHPSGLTMYFSQRAAKHPRYERPIATTEEALDTSR